MEKMIRQVGAFFDDYSETFNASLRNEAADTDRTTAAFADYMVGANPHGVMGSPNNDEFRKSISGGYEFYRGIGVTAMPIVRKEITVLDDYHAMAKVRWRCEFRRRDGTGGSVEFDNIYFVQVRDGVPKIFAWITGDEQQALKDAGLI